MSQPTVGLGYPTSAATNQDPAPNEWPSYSAPISGDGRFVVFGSSASDLVADDTNQWVDVFVHDRRPTLPIG